MTYTREEISRINSGKLASPGKRYIQDNGYIYEGTNQKTLELISGTTPLAPDAATETSLQDINSELDTQTSTLNSIDSKDFATSAKQDLLLAELQLKANLNEVQPVSIQNLVLPYGGSTEAKQDISNLNQYNQIELLTLIYEELQLQTKLLKKIYQ